MFNNSKIFKITIFTLGVSFLLTASCGIYKPVDARKIDPNVNKRVQKNIEEGRGFRIMGAKKNKGGGTFEFASSNAMWRASIDLLDFTPFSNVDYSGGIIITDWFSDESSSTNESLKLTIKFLSNEIRADGINVIIHKKTCDEKNKCNIKKIDSTLAGEIKLAILKEATILDQQDIEKNKVPYKMPGTVTNEEKSLN
jgi:hypothetical protein